MSISLITLIYLYICFRAKQFICDFLLQTQWMAETKGQNGAYAYKALGVHAGIHAIGTLLICLIFAPQLWWLSVVDFFVHGLFDRTKAHITSQNKWTTADTKFWWALGLDQELHNLTHFVYVIVILVS